jgi:hypothetical protein
MITNRMPATMAEKPAQRMSLEAEIFMLLSFDVWGCLAPLMAAA